MNDLMNTPIIPKSLKEHRMVALAFGASLALLLGGLLWLHTALGESTQTLIIHFNNVVRINQTGSLHDLYLIAFFAIVAVLVNFFLAIDLEERDWFLGKLIAAATLGFSVLIFIGFAAIISVN